jgi:RNA polymerase sigma-70 factor (ECF subfamily)
MTETNWQLLQTSLRGWLRKRLRSDADIDDLLQETLVRVHRHLPELQDDDRLLPWAHRIAKHTLIDHYRLRARQLEHDAQSLGAEPDPTATDDNHNELVASWLVPMMHNLPDEYRQALKMAEIEGLSQREMATKLGLSASGARTRVQRARKLLRAELERCCAIVRDRRGNVVDWEHSRLRRKKESDCCN